VRGHRLDDVRDREDARLEQDLVSLEPVGVPRPVETLVVLDHDLRHRLPEGDRLEDLAPRLRVHPDDGELDVAELGRLGEDLGRHGDLADVVDLPGERESFELFLVEPHVDPDRQRQRRHAALVRGRVRVARMPTSAPMALMVSES
jgi:hypothetical protein